MICNSLAALRRKWFPPAAAICSINLCCWAATHPLSPPPWASPAHCGLWFGWWIRKHMFFSVSITWGSYPAHRDQRWSESEPTLEPASLPNTDLLHNPIKDPLTVVSEILLRLHSCAQRRHCFSITDLLQAAVYSLRSVMLPAKCALIPRSRMLCSVVQAIWLRWHHAAQKLFAEREKGRQIYRGLQTQA